MDSRKDINLKRNGTVKAITGDQTSKTVDDKRLTMACCLTGFNGAGRDGG
jgi:hypothetical protein